MYFFTVIWAYNWGAKKQTFTVLDNGKGNLATQCQLSGHAKFLKLATLTYPLGMFSKHLPKIDSLQYQTYMTRQFPAIEANIFPLPSLLTL